MKTITMFWLPVAALEGITKVAITVPWVESEIFVPEMEPARVTLDIGAFAGGQGGVVGSVIVTVTVLLSVILHGVTAAPLTKSYARLRR